MVFFLRFSHEPNSCSPAKPRRLRGRQLDTHGDGGLFFSALLWNQGRFAVWDRQTDGIITKVTTRTTCGGTTSRRPGESLEN